MNSKNKDDKTLTVLQSNVTIMCNYLLHNFFLENAKIWVGRTTLNGRKRKSPRPQNQDLGQTIKWSNLVAAYLPVARLTILDRLVCFESVKDYISTFIIQISYSLKTLQLLLSFFYLFLLFLTYIRGHDSAILDKTDGRLQNPDRIGPD